MVLLMDTSAITAGISAVGALAVVAAGYYFTKKKEREAEWRKEKLTLYRAFIASLSKVLEGESTAEGQIAFATACNDLLLFAPQPVIVALRAFQDETRESNPNKSRQRHDALLAGLLLEMRSDIGIEPKDDPKSFEVTLWASGVKSKAQKGN